jgi:hypothetical protein
MKRYLLVCILGLSTVGCVSTVPFHVGHEKLKTPSAPQHGTVVLLPFKDSRTLTNQMIIGGAGDREKPSQTFIAKQQRPVADILTDYFREALEVSGYQVRTGAAGDLPVLEAEVREFWLSAGTWKALCTTRVLLTLRARPEGPTIWERFLTSEEDDLMIIPNAMQAAVSTLLDEAVQAFTSPEFTAAVNRSANAAGEH